MTTLSLEQNIKAFRLWSNCENVNPDIGSHAQVIPFEGIEQVSVAMSDPSEMIDFPNPVELRGLLSTIKQTDYPNTDQGWPLVSKRMLAALESVGPFPHRVLPARIIEGRIGRSLAEDPRYDDEGNLKPDFYTDDYVLLQLTEHLDAIDLEQSVYDEYDPEMNEVLGLSKPVFKDIGREYPPVFRPLQSPIDIFISRIAKQALEANGIQNLRLFSYDTGYLLLTDNGYISL
jgi:hypothetical protein